MATALIDSITKHGQTWHGSPDEATRVQLIADARSLILELERPFEQMARIGWGEPSRTASLRTAYELGLLAKLSAEDPLSSARLAEGTTADPGLVGTCRPRVLRFPHVMFNASH